MYARLITLAAAVSFISGCGSITGFTDSGSKFACKAPNGVTCTSVSGVYANAQQGNLPALQTGTRPTMASYAMPTGGAALPLAAAGMPIRSQARVLRIWVAPWRDDEDTLHDQNYMYVMVDQGKWLVERSRESTVRKTMTRLRPLGQPRAASAAQPSNEQSASAGTLASVRNDAGAQASAREATVVPGDTEESK
ncbi:TraV family lipoprotein [Massilia sp. CCM 8734]|uniref:TraV family lipoprotein n=1 Tax=Massilia sp. CCM 8734 TaxID=2609283 RepID=UPI00141FF6F9|nr:TraV family lipoprotein [Massilia sp. CCM 8734]NHZ99058.1 TraV family lipoprotein [Massilia sp. CCM 8734]